MEFVDGMNQRLNFHDKTREPRQALELVLQICSALQFADDEQVVRQDTNPVKVPVAS